MKDKLNINLTRASVGEMAARLRDFLAAGGKPLRQNSALEAVARTLNFPNWNTLNAYLPDDREKAPRKSVAKTHRDPDQWMPRIEVDAFFASQLGNQSTIIVIPSAEHHQQAIHDLRRLLSEDRYVRRMAITGPGEQWAPGDDDIVALTLREEWLEDRIRGINYLLDLGCDKYILTPLLDTKLIDFVVEARIATISMWSFMVAEDFDQAMRKLVESDSYFSISGLNNISLLWWPFGTTPDMTQDRGWRQYLLQRLAAADKAEKERLPLTGVSDQVFDEIIATTRQAEQLLDDWYGGDRHTPIEQIVDSPEITAKFAALEKVGPYGLVELRALVRLGLGWDDGSSWEAMLGKAVIDFNRAHTSPSDFIGGTPKLSQVLLDGLKALREMHP